MSEANLKTEQVNSAIGALLSRLEKAEKFVLSELPIICQQIVAERSVEKKFEAITCGLASLLFAAITVGAYFFGTSGEGHTTDRGFVAVMFGGIAGIAAFNFVVCALDAIKHLLTLNAAPKLYILQKLRQLVR
jgi:hypothetical protein